MPPNRQAERTERSTEALLVAAAELIAEGGLAAMTFAAIGERAGYSRGLVTARFGSKSGLVDALIRRVLGRLRALNVLPHAADQPALDALVVLLEGIRDQVRDEPREMRALMAMMFEAFGSDPTLRARIAAYHGGMRDDLVELLQRGIDDHSVRADIDPLSEAVLLVSTMRGIAYQWLLEPEQVDMIEAYDALRSQVLDRLPPR